VGYRPATASNGSSPGNMSEAEVDLRDAEGIARRPHRPPGRPAPDGGTTGAPRSHAPVLMEAGELLYLCASYADDLRTGSRSRGGTASRHHTPLDANDMRFVKPAGFGGATSSSPI